MTDCSWGYTQEETIPETMLNTIPKLTFCKDCGYWDKDKYICNLHDNVYTGYRTFYPLDFCSKGATKEEIKC